MWWCTCLNTESFEIHFDEKEDPTILDLKKRIQEENGVRPSRQTLLLLGYKINNDDLHIKSLVAESHCNEFILSLPKAANPVAGVEISKYVVIGKYQSHMNIYLFLRY